MKTIIIYNQIDRPLEFLIADGDFTRFNGCILNACAGNGFESDFVDWFYKPGTGDYNFEVTTDLSLLENKNWDKVALVTWLP